MAKEPVPQEVVEMLTFLSIHKVTIASFFGIRLIPSSRERNINRILEFPGDHMIIHDTILGVPSAFLAIYCSRPTFENIRGFLSIDVLDPTFDFLHKRHGIWKTKVRLADDGAPIVSFIITNVTNVLPLEELASIPVSKVHDHNITLVEAAEVTLNRVKKRMPAVIALLQEFLPDVTIETEEGTFSKSSFIHALKNDTFSLADKIEVGSLTPSLGDQLFSNFAKALNFGNKKD